LHRLSPRRGPIHCLFRVLLRTRSGAVRLRQIVRRSSDATHFEASAPERDERGRLDVEPRAPAETCGIGAELESSAVPAQVQVAQHKRGAPIIQVRGIPRGNDGAATLGRTSDWLSLNDPRGQLFQARLSHDFRAVCRTIRPLVALSCP